MDEKHKKARKKFQEKMAALEKRQAVVLERMHKKFDEQKAEIIRKKIKNL